MSARALVGFAGGLGVGLVAVLGALRPPGAVAAWARLRRGAGPSQGGVVMTLAPAPPALAGADDGGATVIAWFENAGRAPAPLCWREVPGDELGFRVETDAGPCPPREPDAPQVPPPSRALRRTTLAPGERLGLVCDLRRWVQLPPGARGLRVVGDRAPLGDPVGGFDGQRCVSAPLRLP